MLQGNERILVVDDDSAVCETFAKGLSHVGYRCETAGSADDADRALKQEEFDLMLLDIGMPGKTGLAFLPEVTYRYPNLAVVMVTGNDQLDTAVLAMREGAYDYVTKPVPLGLLVNRVEKVLLRRAEKLEGVVHEPNLSPQQGRRGQSRMAGEERAGEAVVTMESAGTDFGSAVESLADIAKGIGLARSASVKTGEVQLDEKLGGGLPLGSLTLIEGASSTGKSVLCQHLIYGALMTKTGVACYSSEFTFQSLLTQMYSIGLDLTKCPPGAQLSVYPLEEPVGDEEADPLLAELSLAISSVPDSLELIFVDAITNLASYSGDRSILSFFSSCKRLTARGKTIVLVAHGSTFEERMSVRLRALCDGYLVMRVETMGDKLSNMLEVRKILNAERPTGNVVYFSVQPGMGIRVNPFSRASA